MTHDLAPTYGIDLSECHFQTEGSGKRTHATIPYRLFSMLIEFRTSVTHPSNRLWRLRTRLSAALKPRRLIPLSHVLACQPMHLLLPEGLEVIAIQVRAA
jgi:hypothetical protein